MKVARKLTLALMIGIALVMGVSAWLQVSRERDLFATDTAAAEELVRVMESQMASNKKN